MLDVMYGELNYNSPKSIAQFLRENGMAPTRRFGQNFLISQAVREKILRLLELPQDGTVWEIGPGLGAMTHMLVERAARSVLFEIDRRFIEYLNNLYKEHSNVRIVAGDVVKTWKQVYAEEGLPKRIMGNLPYNTASMIIGDLIESGCVAERMVFTVQKEVAARMSAKPGTRDYSAFSVICQFACSVSDAGVISPGAFYPQPHVDSAVVLMQPHGRYRYELLSLVSTITKALFSARRKTIRNTLGRSVVATRYGKPQLYGALEATGIDAGQRGEELPVETIVALAVQLEQ
mgnify:CR=1 FL=1